MAGMLPSKLGFFEVPLVLAPAGVTKLAQHVRMKTFARVTRLPFFLVPGVRIGRAPCELSEVAHSDVIRREETEIAGFQASAQTRVRGAPGLLLHVGSHCKAIKMDSRGPIVRSASTLSGEVLHALRTQTILASRLRDLRSQKLLKRFFAGGAKCTQRYGLSRALFMTRLLEGNSRYRQRELYNFLLGSLGERSPSVSQPWTTRIPWRQNRFKRPTQSAVGMAVAAHEGLSRQRCQSRSQSVGFPWRASRDCFRQSRIS